MSKFKKPYEAHENFYRKMKAGGVTVWEKRKNVDPELRKANEDGVRAFLNNLLSQSWVLEINKVIELGCGTGDILRYICRGDIAGLGIDVSPTAIQMAEEQSEESNLKFKTADLCDRDFDLEETFNLAIDGHCLHCILEDENRGIFLSKVFDMLDSGGVFAVMSMCCPWDEGVFSREFARQSFLEDLVYIPFDKADQFEGGIEKDGVKYLPTRKVPHWEDLLIEIENAGFEIKLHEHLSPKGKAPFDSISIGALKP